MSGAQVDASVAGSPGRPAGDLAQLTVRDAVVEYRGARGTRVRAVAGVSLDVRGGEVVGLVGESGCGKSSLGRAVVGLEPLAGGSVELDGRPVGRVGGGARSAHDRRLQMVFQNPYASLNPRRRVGDQIGDGLAQAGAGSARAGSARADAVAELLTSVGLPPGVAARYPHEFSGGQRQRIAIARALAPRPAVVVADEPVSALDAATRAQVAGLIAGLAREQGVGVLMISHDLAGLRAIADRIEVMYLGRVVESGPTEQIWTAPQHPYTRALIAAIPQLGLDAPRPTAPRGEVPDPASPPSGCRFHPRCPIAVARCADEEPPTTVAGEGHRVACWLAGAAASGPAATGPAATGPAATGPAATGPAGPGPAVAP